MKGIISAVYKKMLGERYGFDEISKVQIWILLILIIVNLFVKSYIVGLLQIVTIGIIIYRFMSKDTFKRLRENEKYCEFRYSLFKPFKNIKRNLTDRKHIYKKCRCGTTVKVGLPKKCGFKKTTCPNCDRKVRLFTLRSRK